MPTNVRTDGKNLVTQYCMATVVQPADPVLLKPKGDPGVALHTNNSGKINNPAGTVFDHNTQVAHSDSYLGMGMHLPIVMVGRNTGQVNGDNGFLSWMKNVYIEKRNAVMHAVQTGVNSLWSMLPKEIQAAVQNGENIVAGMTTDDFVGAAKDDAQEMLDALMSKDTLIALGQTAVMMGVAAIPVVGEIVDGVAAVQRIKGVVEQTAGAADELKEMMGRWGQPMSPAQQAAERKKLASWIMRVGVGLLLAALGKALKKVSGKSKGKENSTKEAEAGTGPKAKQTSCACATGNPVIIATGEKKLGQTDFSLPGLIPITWERSYRSGDARTGWFGQGWTTPLAVTLRLGADTLLYHDAQGRHVDLPALAIGAEHFDAYEQFTLRRPSPDAWEIAFKSGLTQRFVRPRDDLFLLPLAEIVDRNDNRIAFDYPAPPDDPFDPWRPERITDSVGRRLQLDWNDRHQLIQVKLYTSAWEPHLLARYQYDAQGDLIEQLDAAGAQRRFEWRNHVLVAYTQPDGDRYCAEYDEYSPSGRVSRSYAAADGRGLTFDYHDRARTTNVTDSLGRTTVYEYDERKDIIAATQPDGSRVETPFDSNGNPRAAVDPLGRSTQMQFDDRGNLLALVDANGAAVHFKYNADDQPTQIIDALQHAWRRDYDEHGNLVDVIDPLGHDTHYAHDARGLPIAITDARGGIKRLDWDQDGNLAAYTDCSGRRTHFAYDDQGRMLSSTNALNQASSFTWDAAGRLLQSTDATGATHQYQWSPAGRLLRYTDPLGAVTRYAYNPHGDPVERVDANGHTLRYEYDSVGRLARLVNENGEATQFSYDINDRLTDEIGFDGRHQRYLYNAANELTHLIEAGGTEYGPGKLTHFARDAVGRLLARTAEGDASASAAYQYDPNGRLVEARNPAAALAFAYDPLGQLLSETQALPDADPRTLAHRYDVLGNRIQTTLPDQRTLNWLFYGSGHLHQINLETDGQHHTIVDIERDALHRETQRTQGQLTSEYDYDPMGRLVRHRAAQNAAGSGIALERQYRYDLGGNLIARLDSLRGEQAFRYDPTGRILSAKGLHDEAFAFDPAGNLLDAGRSAPVKGNRIEVYQDLRYEYDIHGNVTRLRKGAHTDATLNWNAAHQLIEAIVTRNGTAQTTRYEYDALGRRTRKIDAFGATDFLWDGDLMIQSRRAHKEALYLFEPNSFVPLATVQDGETYWYQCDQIGLPQELTDRNGRVVWAAEYRVWGEVAKLRTGTTDQAAYTTEALPLVEQPFRLQGQWLDEETGLHYNRFRYYEPVIGRFVSPDPIGLMGGENLYVFANNPIGWIDPSGLTAAKLKSNMVADGRNFSKGQTPHHIVQENCGKNQHVKNSRELLKKNGIDIDSSPNGARVWGTSNSQINNDPFHPGRGPAMQAGNYHAGPHIHSDANDKLIYQILKGVDKRGGDMESALRDIGARMENGSWKVTFGCCCS